MGDDVSKGGDIKLQKKNNGGRKWRRVVEMRTATDEMRFFSLFAAFLIYSHFVKPGRRGEGIGGGGKE